MGGVRDCFEELLVSEREKLMRGKMDLREDAFGDGRQLRRAGSWRSCGPLT